MHLMVKSSGDPASAREICERQINSTAKAIFDYNFEDFEVWFALPFEFETFDAKRTIETRADLEMSFQRVHRYYRRIGATRLERRCIEAEFRDQHTLNSTHETRVMREGELLLEPYPTFVVSHLIEGRWRIVKSTYAIDDQPEFVHAVIGDE